MKLQRVLLLLVPDERSLLHPIRRNIPSLALGQLQGYLRSEGFDVVLEDLGVALDSDIVAAPHRHWKYVLDKRFVLEALERGTHLDEVSNLFDPLLAAIDFSSVDAIGISTGADFSLFEIHSAFLIGKLVMSRYPGVPVVFGGTNIKYLYLFKETYRELWSVVAEVFPYIFVGPGERSLAKLFVSLRDGAAASYSTLRGAICNAAGAPRANAEDLASLACPDFSGLRLDAYSTCVHRHDANRNDSEFYRFPYPQNVLCSDRNRGALAAGERREVVFLPYIFNHHCAYNCAFCEESAENKRMPWSKDAAGVVDDLARLVDTYGTQYFYFFDNTFNYTPTFVRQFCKCVQDRGLEISWSDCARVNGMKRELLELMYGAGCRKLVFGLETASLRLLQYVNKRLDLDHFKTVLSWCKEIGIWADVEVIVGFPHETEEDFDATYRFLEENRALINCFALNKYFVVPSSLMGRYPERYGIRLAAARGYDDILACTASALDRSAPASRATDTSFHLLSFEEIDGRPHELASREAAERYTRMLRLLFGWPVFRDAAAALRPRTGS